MKQYVDSSDFHSKTISISFSFIVGASLLFVTEVRYNKKGLGYANRRVSFSSLLPVDTCHNHFLKCFQNNYRNYVMYLNVSDCFLLDNYSQLLYFHETWLPLSKRIRSGDIWKEYLCRIKEKDSWALLCPNIWDLFLLTQIWESKSTLKGGGGVLSLVIHLLKKRNRKTIEQWSWLVIQARLCWRWSKQTSPLSWETKNKWIHSG